MSNRNNDVFQVLPTKGNQALVADGVSIDTLKVGQLGCFDADTFLGVTTASAVVPKNVFFAVGVDANGGFDAGAGTDMASFRQSAGQFIQRKNITDDTLKAYVAGTPMTVAIANSTVNCETEYGMRVEFRNSKIQRIQGYNQFTKTYFVTTGCCADCDPGCGTVDPSELSILFVDAINADPAKLLVAKYIAKTAITDGDGTTTGPAMTKSYTAGEVMVLADVQALIAWNKTVAGQAAPEYADFQVTSVPLSVGTYCGVNLEYYKLLETTLIVSLVQGFACSGAATVSTYPVYSEGSGVNIQQREYHSEGWRKSPYRLSEVTGTAKAINYLADKGVNYDQTIVQYNQTSESGWQEYSNTLSTVIAVPEADNTTAAAVALLITKLKS